jgi:chemotaxis protein MotA
MEVAGKLLEGFGGYTPTVGIIGAVLGLIHVMRNLSNPDAIGPGIAVAFVATVYGVGFANLWFMPMGTKVKRKAAIMQMRNELIKVGVQGIQEGLNPHFLKEKLEVFLEHKYRPHEDGKH